VIGLKREKEDEKIGKKEEKRRKKSKSSSGRKGKERDTLLQKAPQPTEN